MADPIPKVHGGHPFVYHYTARAGLEGILTEQTLFATHYKYLNDSSEIQHMKSALIRNFQHFTKSWIRKRHTGEKRQTKFLTQQGGEHILAYKIAEDFIDRYYDVTFGDGDISHPFIEPFITSFCSHSNDEDYERENGLLSQWRGYSELRENGGFALVFDTERLAKLLERENDLYCLSGLTFRDVVYDGDNEMFRREFHELLKNLDDSLDQIMRGDPRDVGKGLPHFLSGVSRFKHRAFREEREVRIIISPETPESFDYLKKADPTIDAPQKAFKEIFNRDGTSKPTTRLFDYEKEEKLPVVKIIVGPGRRQSENVDFATALVEHLAMDVKIRRSETPYTG